MGAEELMEAQAKAVFWTASFDSATGQALVTARVARSDYGIKWRMAIYPPAAKGIPGFARAVFTLWRSTLFGSYRLVYLVCSRSIPGFLRDIPALLTAFFGVRVVVHAHGSDLPDLLNKRFIGRIAKSLYSRCEIIVPSAHLLAPLTKYSCTRVHLVENFSRKIHSTNLHQKGRIFRILWNSNIMASKGIRELVEGAKLARASGLALELVILGRPLGDGKATLAEIEAYRDMLLNIDWIDIRGPVTPEVAELELTEADLVVLPSNYPSECQPLAIVQAMCAGRKLIVADTPALRATLGAYPGRLVPPEPKKIACAIFEESTTTAINSDAVAEAVARFDPARFDAKMTEILNSKINNI